MERVEWSWRTLLAPVRETVTVPSRVFFVSRETVAMGGRRPIVGRLSGTGLDVSPTRPFHVKHRTVGRGGDGGAARFRHLVEDPALPRATYVRGACVCGLAWESSAFVHARRCSWRPGPSVQRTRRCAERVHSPSDEDVDRPRDVSRETARCFRRRRSWAGGPTRGTR